MSCSGPRRMDARYEWFGSAGEPPARLAGNADYFHDMPRRSVSATHGTRRGSVRLSDKTFRRRGPDEGSSRDARRLTGSTAHRAGATTRASSFPGQAVELWQAAAARCESHVPALMILCWFISKKLTSWGTLY